MKHPPLKLLAATAADYSHVEVKLIGLSNNAFHIIGAVRKALIRAGASKLEIELFTEEATSGNYDHLLATVQRWVTVI